MWITQGGRQIGVTHLAIVRDELPVAEVGKEIARARYEMIYDGRLELRLLGLVVPIDMSLKGGMNEAFELQTLQGRRALDEQLRALGPRYTLAMIDVDHFKKFNDTHGHDIGDQVLKLVAARLAETGGGGLAFRYGGEEFSVLFPGRSLKEALPYLERTRAAVERYRMAVRSDERSRHEEAGIRRRGDAAPTKLLSVTVSVGAAEPEVERQPPAQVLKAADEALYRAKKGGRNRVCT
jgi:diguanylate cyclase (GGDEF)-like protein